MRLGTFTVWTLIVAGALWFVGGTAMLQHRIFYANGAEWFCDYRMTRNCSAAENVYRPELEDRKDACYLPIAYDFATLFPRDIRKGAIAFDIVGGLCFFAGLAALLTSLRKREKSAQPPTGALFVAVAASYPTIFVFNVANQMLVAAAGVFVFFASRARLQTERGVVREIWRWTGLAGLAVAAAFKISPVLFSLVLLKGRDGRPLREWLRSPGVRDFLALGLATATLALVPFAWHGGFVGFTEFLETLPLHADFCGIRDFWGAIGIDRTIEIALGRGIDATRELYPLTRGVNVLAGLAALVAFLRSDRPARTLLFLSMALMLLPGSSMAYTALLLVPAFAEWTISVNARRERLADGLAALCWIAIFAALQIPVGGGCANRLLGAAAIFGVWLEGRRTEAPPRD